MDISIEGDNLHDVQHYGQELHERKTVGNGKRNQFEVISYITLVTLIYDKKKTHLIHNNVQIVYFIRSHY